MNKNEANSELFICDFYQYLFVIFKYSKDAPDIIWLMVYFRMIEFRLKLAYFLSIFW